MSRIILPLTMLSANRRSPSEVLGRLKDPSPSVSKEAATSLLSDVRNYACSLRDYLRIAVDPAKDNSGQFDGMNGYEASLAYLGLPVKDDFDAGVPLDLASDTFNTFPGVRALFPEVIDDMVQWKYRADNIEVLEPMLAGSRTINGTEMITTVVDDKESDYQGTRPVAEMANIPVRSIRATQKSVTINKFGGGYRVSYEFSRRARIDMLTPYVNRSNRELEMSKVAMATNLLINGDGTANHPAAAVVNQSTLNAFNTPTNGRLNYMSLLQWLVKRAENKQRIDTVVGNYDAYLQWLALFAIPTSGAVDPEPAVQNLARAGFQLGGVPILQWPVNFALSTSAPAGQLIGFTRGETLEQLTEAGSLIDEQERMPGNQTVTYYKTEVSGCRIVFGDTRHILNYAA
jgi:hypothetical protein